MVRFHIACDVPFPRAEFWRMRAAPGFLRFVVSDGLLKSICASPAQYDEHGVGRREQQYTPASVDCPAVVRAVVGDTLFEVRDEQTWNDALRPFAQEFKIRPSFLAGLSKTAGWLTLEEVPTESEGAEEEEEVMGDVDEGDDGEGAGGTGATDALALTEDVSVAGTGSEGSGTDPDAEGSEGSDAGGVDARPGGASDVWAALPREERCVHVVEGETRVAIMTVGWFVERSIVHNLRLFYAEYPKTLARFRTFIYDRFAGGDYSVPVAEVVDRFLADDAERERESRAEELAAATKDAISRDDCANALTPTSVQALDPESIFVDA